MPKVGISSTYGYPAWLSSAPGTYLGDPFFRNEQVVAVVRVVGNVVVGGLQQAGIGHHAEGTVAAGLVEAHQPVGGVHAAVADLGGDIAALVDPADAVGQDLDQDIGT